jgi:hypothetical protein
MSLTSLADLSGAFRQRVEMHKGLTSNSQAIIWGSLSRLTAGDPVAIPAPSNTTTGTVPVAGDTGFPTIQPFTGNAHITWWEFGALLEAASSSAGRIMVHDRLWQAGPFSINTTTTFASQPSYAGRIPNSDYSGLQLWIEGNAQSGTPGITVTYTNQSGVAGRSTTFTMTSLGGAAGSVQVPLASGDSGVQKVESISLTNVAGSGTVNLFVARPLLWGRIEQNNGYMRSEGLENTGMPQVFSDTAFAVMFCSNTTAFGPLHVSMELAAK